jgi:uncharacterized small protein (DUF1192 family)
MQTNERTNRAVIEAVAALDFTEENRRIAELEDEILRLESAMERGKDRCNAIARQIHESKGPDGQAVGDALLADELPTDAARAGPNLEQLAAEKDALLAGIRDLSKRVEAARLEITGIQGRAGLKAAEAVAPLAVAAVAEMEQAAAVIFRSFATLDALHAATRRHYLPRQKAVQAIGGIAGPGGITSWRSSVPVPDDAREALAGLASKGKALPVALIATARPA